MRKLLLGTTALAAAATLTANAALADVSISGSHEFRYNSRSSNLATSDGTTFDTDGEVTFKFSNKTDSGLTIAHEVQLMSDGGDTAIDESFLTISGGFGKIMLGQDDGVGDNYGLAAVDLIAEETGTTGASATIATNSDIDGMSANADKVAYHLPAMGGLTAGVSFADSGTNTGTDTTAYGFRYTTEAAGSSITIGGASATSEVSGAADKDSQNLGIKIVNGNLSFAMSQGTEEAADENQEMMGAALSYKMGNGMTLGAYTVDGDDSLDAGEEYTASGFEVQYTIASGLTAVVIVEDYEYKAPTTADAAGTTVSDSGTNSRLVIKASF
ncbi:MAG: porin [Candidatus Puniceispirillales bacterium]